MAEAKDEKSTIPAAMRERLTKEKDAFWARKVSFAVAMKVALHTMEEEKAKASALEIMGRDVLIDLQEHYGEKLDMKAFIADCQQLTAELVAEYRKLFGG